MSARRPQVVHLFTKK